MRAHFFALSALLSMAGCGSADRPEPPEPDKVAPASLPLGAALPAGSEPGKPDSGAYAQRNAPRWQERKPATPEAEPAAPPQPVALADLIERVEPAVVRLDVKLATGKATGSGFVVDEQGTIVTNFHVLDGARSARATFHDGATADLAGTLLLVPDKDIAIALLSSMAADVC